jgi:hypothetical protein
LTKTKTRKMSKMSDLLVGHPSPRRAAEKSVLRVVKETNVQPVVTAVVNARPI